LVIKFDFNNMLKIAKFCLTLNTVDPAVKPREDEECCGKTKNVAGRRKELQDGKKIADDGK
jgi:hypothetical protein